MQKRGVPERLELEPDESTLAFSQRKAPRTPRTLSEDHTTRPNSHSLTDNLAYPCSQIVLETTAAKFPQKNPALWTYADTRLSFQSETTKIV
jgi:hypothetical protein